MVPGRGVVLCSGERKVFRRGSKAWVSAGQKEIMSGSSEGGSVISQSWFGGPSDDNDVLARVKASVHISLTFVDWSAVVRRGFATDSSGQEMRVPMGRV
ncbi:hypothetical protein L1987_10114 [Smallanthus sonchifolius]|uniref:Uncharacterized protein n=1 Tax=Smallanthus sonchifolius TaxID=185202 RepID=A0ACB9JR70_9ASTR|nr:hypothetical protein L1987_10114 [Smallanthus sonchifolius]